METTISEIVNLLERNGHKDIDLYSVSVESETEGSGCCSWCYTEIAVIVVKYEGNSYTMY